MKMSIPREKPSAFLSLQRRSQTCKLTKTLDGNIEESHLRGLPFDHGTKKFVETGSVLHRKVAG